MTSRMTRMILLRLMCIMAVAIMCTTVSAAVEDPARMRGVVKELVAEAKQAVDSMTVDELSARLHAGDTLVVLDVRTEAEYEAGHIRGSVWIPRGKLEFMAPKKLPSTKVEIVVYCKRDSRGGLAAARLKRIGFTDVTYLVGGLERWVTSGYSIYNRHGELSVTTFEKSEGN
ncbi:MAG: hypothetical protein GF341_09435 [candidate division Zixibacteria bacterium]|nr:hypothetical protein [candidate division Zixibacteria bacterium]